MSDPIDPKDPIDLLDGLAPDVDDDTAANVFATERARRRRNRRVLTGVAAAALVALVTVPAALGLAGLGDDDEPVASTDGDAASGDPDEGSGVTSGALTFEVLQVLTDSGEQMGTMRAALDDDALADVWAAFGQASPPPEVDFEQAFVLTITIPDDACPPTLEAFEAPENAFVPVFVEPDVACNEPLIPKTFVVAIDRLGLPDRVLFRLPADDAYRLPEYELLVDLGAGVTDGPGPAPGDEPDPDPALPGQAVDTYPFEGASLVAVGLADGEFLAVFDLPDPTSPVVAELLWSDTGIVATGRNRSVDGEFWSEITFQGAVGWARTQSLLAPLDTTDEIVDRLFPDPADRPVADEIGIVARAVVDAIGVEEFGRVAMFDFPDDTSQPGSVRVDIIGLGDDSVYGIRLLVTTERSADGRLVLTSVEQRALCGRGASADGCL